MFISSNAHNILEKSERGIERRERELKRLFFVGHELFVLYHKAIMRRAICKYFYPADKRKRGGNKVEYSTAFYIPMKNTLGGGGGGVIYHFIM